MDEIRDIFSSIDGALPETPFASFTGPARDGRAAAAAGTLAPPDGRHYVAYLERPPDDRASDGAPPVSYVDEDLKPRADVDAPGRGRCVTASGYRLRYLEAFASPFEAGERYRFFWEALHPPPEEDDTDEQRERDRRRGLARVEDLIRGRAARSLCDEILRAEEEESRGPDPEHRAFWSQAAATGREELARLIPDPDRREGDLALHRYRRAANPATAADEP